MINQEKIRLMTQAECYRQREQNKALAVNRYGKRSYVSMQVVKSLILCTAAAAAAAFMYAVVEGERLLGENNPAALRRIVVMMVIVYVAAMMICAAVSRRTYTRIYVRAHMSVKYYFDLLRKINEVNEQEKKEKRRLTEPLPRMRKETGEQ